MIILVCNDDGIHSEGLHALEAALAKIGEIYTVAPGSRTKRRESFADVASPAAD